MAAAGFRGLAMVLAKETFLKQHAHPFLIGAPPLHAPRVSRGTMTFQVADVEEVTSVGLERPVDAPAERVQLDLAVAKTQDTFPDMITVGRTANNDIVLVDVSVSKLHAYFREVNGHWELYDAGSRNGTHVGGKQLVARGAGVALKTGDHVRFGTVDLTFVDAGMFWDLCRRR